jgi:Trypsin-co-occurring domain 1
LLRYVRAVSTLLDLELEGGGSVLVEIAAEPDGPVVRGGRRQQQVVEAGRTLEAVLADLGPTAQAIVGRLRSLAQSPDEIQVEFGVKLNASARLVVAQSTGEANFRVALRWAAPSE